MTDSAWLVALKDYLQPHRCSMFTRYKEERENQRAGARSLARDRTEGTVKLFQTFVSIHDIRWTVEQIGCGIWMIVRLSTYRAVEQSKTVFGL